MELNTKHYKMSLKKTLRKIKKMQQNDEMEITVNDETYDIICIEKQQYLLFTTDSFYEMNYEELKDKINR